MSRCSRLFPIAPFAIVLLLAVALGGGCDNDSSKPPPPGNPRPTFENIWPNADSTTWTYLVTERSWEADSARVYPSRDLVPPAPTMDEVIRRLAVPDPGHAGPASEGVYRLRFEGMMTTESGVQAQRLRERIYNLDGTDPAPDPAALDPFLDRLAQVRPDLRTKMAALRPEGARRASDLSFAPLFLHGGAWERGSNWIGTYGDVDTLLAWKFLGRNLSVGVEFVHPLVPSLAPDVRLYGRTVRERSLRTEAGAYENCLECAYMVDYGPAQVAGEGGEALGWVRGIDIGSIVFAPEVGPIWSEERRGAVPGGESARGRETAITIGLTGRRSGPAAGR